jgi:hypothetical protein
MGLFRKKPDPISERAKMLTDQIAAIEAEIQRLSDRADNEPPNGTPFAHHQPPSKSGNHSSSVIAVLSRGCAPPPCPITKPRQRRTDPFQVARSLPQRRKPHRPLRQTRSLKKFLKTGGMARTHPQPPRPPSRHPSWAFAEMMPPRSGNDSRTTSGVLSPPIPNWCITCPREASKGYARSATKREWRATG